MIERGPWYYFIPPMQDYVPEREWSIRLMPKQVNDPDFGKPDTLLQKMLDEDEAGKRNGRE